MNYIDNLIAFIASLDGQKIIRFFWFFFFFELIRFFLVDLIILIFWKVNRRRREKKMAKARNQLFQENPLVSIIVPGRNEGENLFQLATSLKEQTYQNFELIIIDDGSDDDTKIICQSLLNQGLIKQCLRNDVRGGKASAANLGFRYSKGKFIIHIDADCSFDRDAIENILVPFYLDAKIGAIGGNVQVRNYNESLCTTLQAIEYYDNISIGRIALSQLGIYRQISGAFGAFKREVLTSVGAWDIGPGLDGDITVKVRKLKYKIHFEPTAVCQTRVPNTFRKLVKQRLRWDKSLVRFRLRKHKDVFFPTASFNWANFISFVENITFNLVLNFKWYVYILDVFISFSGLIAFIIPINLFIYTVYNYVKYILFSMFRERKNQHIVYFLPYMPLLVFYFGYFLRIVRTVAYLQEFFLRKSYEDEWNPAKSSRHAKAMRI
jgi:cellulose synthase/poly-beta-1,6-N-acetylglucosamine synthase-like glycosyltransferase